MEFKDAVDTIFSSEKFSGWRSSNLECYLTYAMTVNDGSGVWEFGFFDAKTNKMTTFRLSNGEIQVFPDQDVLRSADAITELKPSVVKVSADFVMSAAEAVRAEHYRAQLAIKSFFVIQVLDGRPVFNVTYFTRSFKTLNVKISAEDGSVIEHSLVALADFS